MRLPAALVASLILVAACPLPGMGQEPGISQEPGMGQEPVRLTLDEAVTRALGQNPAYQQTLRELELSALDRRELWLNLLPQPQVDLLTTSMAWNRQRVAEGFFGEVTEREDPGTIHTSRTQQRLGLFVTVDLAEFFQFRGIDETARIREAGATVQGRELKARVASAFLEVQERTQALELEEELLEVARENRDLARRLYALARRDRIDLVSMELEVAEQEDALERSRTELESARLALRTLMGDPDLGDFQVEPEPLRPLEPEGLDEEALVRRGREVSPRIVQAEAQRRASAGALSRNRARWLPTLTFSAGTTRQGFVQGSDAFFDLRPDAGWDRAVSLSVRFPDLGLYLNRRTEQRRGEVDLRNREDALLEARAEVEREVRTLVRELQGAARTLRTQERRTALAEEQVELAREAYRLGRLSYLELREAQARAAESRRQALSARYSVERGRRELEALLDESLSDPRVSLQAPADPGDGS